MVKVGDLFPSTGWLHRELNYFDSNTYLDKSTDEYYILGPDNTRYYFDDTGDIFMRVIITRIVKEHNDDARQT